MIRLERYVSFPWYDLPEMRWATDAFWHALAAACARRGITDVPPQLDRAQPHGVDPEGACLFTQTCGYPLFTTALDHFAVLGSPHYAVPGAIAGTHRSYVVVAAGSPVRRLGDLREKRFAINELDSNSGMNLPRRLFAPLARDGRFFAEVSVSGSHAASAEAVASGAVDAAAIDCVTFALLARYRPHVIEHVRVVGETFATATPPFVTARANVALVKPLRDALADVFASDAGAQIRDATFLCGLTPCDAHAYDCVMTFEREALALGYPRLA